MRLGITTAVQCISVALSLLESGGGGSLREEGGVMVLIVMHFYAYAMGKFKIKC